MLKLRPKFNLCLLVVMLAGLLAACGGTSTTPTPAASPGATTAALATTIAASNPAATAGASTSTSAAASATSPLPAPASKDIPIISPLQAETKALVQNWRVSLDDGSGPQVIGEQDGLVFVRTRQNGFYALDARTGALAWKLPSPPLAGPLPAFDPLALAAPGVAIVGDLNAEKITAYDSKTGQKKWDYGVKFDAPRRDVGSRFLGGKVYENTLVIAVSSKQDPFNAQSQSQNPEYILVVGVDLATGREVWNALTDQPPLSATGRLGNVIFGSKLVIIESPDLTVGAVEGATGTRKWRVLNLLLLRNDNPDILFSVVPEAGVNHLPRLRKVDLETGKLLWEKILPVQTVNDPPIAISPDERRAYVAVAISDKESYTFAVDLEKIESLWRYTTKTYGIYSLTATNEGVRLRNYGKQAGIVYLARENPVPQVWALGGIELGEELITREGLYVTGRQETKGGFVFLADLQKGNILFATKIEPELGDAVAGSSQLYVPALNAGKPVIYAFNRPGP